MKATPPAAVTLSDRTALAVVGVPWRSLRPVLVAGGVRMVKVGRRTIVRVDDVLRVVGLGDGQAAASPSTAMTDAQVIELATRRRAP